MKYATGHPNFVAFTEHLFIFTVEHYKSTVSYSKC